MTETSPSIKVSIDGLSTDGRGVAHIGGIAYFISGVLPGDLAEITLDQSTNPPSGELRQIVEPSPHRITHPCPEAVHCTGTVWGCLSYNMQLEHKRDLVLRTLKKAVGEIEVLPVVASPHPWQYRNRVSLSVWSEPDCLRIGYQTEARREDGVPIQTCFLAHSNLHSCIQALADNIPEIDLRQESLLPRRIQVHQTSIGAGLMLVFPTRIDRGLGPRWQTLLKRVPAPGGLWLAEGSRAGIISPHRPALRIDSAKPIRTSWMGRDIDVHPSVFCQANDAAAEMVLKRLKDYGETNRFSRVWDLYGGYGALGFAARGDRPLTVLEYTPASQTTFLRLAEMTKNTRAEFVAGDLIQSLQIVGSEIHPDDLVIVDPPKSGVHEDVLKMVSLASVRNVIYLSCNPARLGRDLARFLANGFAIHVLQPYDFFPQTPRVEVLCFLKR